jgi:DNA-3-methyladenine glycosylase II
MKVSFLKDLSRRILNGSLDLKNIHTLNDESVIEHLCAVKGIGRWTAEMFLMFALARPDVFSHGDLGLKNGIKKLYRLRKHAPLSRAEKIAEKWKPYRTYAARYLWASNDLE